MSDPAAAFRCAVQARERIDPMAGTAPPAQRWLLLEHPGPWPIDAVAGSGIEPAMLAALTAAADRRRTRILMVRRPGRIDRGAERRWMLTALDTATVSGPWNDDNDLTAAATALEADPGETGALPTPSGDPASMILVCAHGVHDTCCAIRGRPVAAALTERWPDRVWECSHVGGDRFAPNVVLLPDGFYYGNLDPVSAVQVVEHHLAGRVSPESLRGMARFVPPVQAAAIAAYAQFGPLGADEVTVTSSEQFGPRDGHGSETTVELSAGPHRLRAQVRAVRRAEARLTCRAPRATPATEYQILSLDPVGEASR